jgi:hypothetical protein
MEKLPSDVTFTIFNFLKGADLLQCNLVCKQWKDIIDSERLWKNVAEREWPICIKKELIKGENFSCRKKVLHWRELQRKWIEQSNSAKQMTLEGMNEGKQNLN